MNQQRLFDAIRYWDVRRVVIRVKARELASFIARHHCRVLDDSARFMNVVVDLGRGHLEHGLVPFQRNSIELVV